jgi:ankyrin repeat protein
MKHKICDYNMNDNKLSVERLFIDEVIESDVESAAKFCEKHPLDVNYVDDEDGTALHAATYAGKLDMVTFLLVNNDVRVNTLDKKGHTALFYSVMFEDIEITKLLLSKGANPNIYTNVPILHHAASSGHKDLVNLLIENGASIDTCTSDGNNILLSICYAMVRYEGCGLDTLHYFINRGLTLVGDNK